MKFRLIGEPATATSGSGEYEKGVDTPLKPCPFCGSADITINNTHTPCYWSECNSCGSQGPSAYATDEAEASMINGETTTAVHKAVFAQAITYWNDRGVAK